MPSNETLREPVFLAPSQIKTIAVIGGGASGAVVTDSLLKEKSALEKIVVFERRGKLGGVWALDEDAIKTPNHIVKPGYSSLKTDPQLSNPFHDLDNKSSQILVPRATQERFEQTPSYKGIKTNILERMMTYSDVPQWDVPGASDDERIYVDGLVVQKYIESYIHKNIEDPRLDLVTRATVEDVERIPRETHNPGEIAYRFRLTIRKYYDETRDIWYQQDFDSVVVAVGHYHVPFIPEVEGLELVQQKFPSVVEHAKFYREPSNYADKKVVVVGSRASGADLTKQIAKFATTVYQSIRTASMKESKYENVVRKPVIKKYTVSDNGFKVHFDDGTEIENPDKIIYGTGYDFSYPFLNRLTDSKITLDGKICPDLFQHTFLINEPLITFVGIPIDGISFRVFEFQAVLVARYLAGKIKLPSSAEQKQWTIDRFNSKGVTRAYHTIGPADALEYSLGLAKLGQIESSKHEGRPFPTFTPEDLEKYVGAARRLASIWDDF